MAAPIREAHALEQCAGSLPRLAVKSAQLRRQKHIFFRGQRGNKLIRLEHEANLAPSQTRQGVLFQMRDIDSVQDDSARSRGIQARQ